MKKNLFTLCALISILSSCGIDDVLNPELKTKTLSIMSGQRVQLMISPNTEGCTFVSDQELTAAVSPSGEVTGLIIGRATITAFDRFKKVIGQCVVTVNPKYAMYREPCLPFGATKTIIKSYETRYLTQQTTTTLVYQGENPNVEQVGYTFENNYNVSSACLIPIGKIELLTSFLAERYVYIGEGTDGILAIFLSPDKEIYVGIGFLNLSQVVAIYLPNNNMRSKAADTSSEFAKYLKKLQLNTNELNR